MNKLRDQAPSPLPLCLTETEQLRTACSSASLPRRDNCELLAAALRSRGGTTANCLQQRFAPEAEQPRTACSSASLPRRNNCDRNSQLRSRQSAAIETVSCDRDSQLRSRRDDYELLAAALRSRDGITTIKAGEHATSIDFQGINMLYYY
ncbi:MAG: hypothetical protein QNJ54_31445 [Prochloraceae cyanobacterium]|nr:hypothetical protein [Prochloraceae cyanobacterium]